MQQINVSSQPFSPVPDDWADTWVENPLEEIDLIIRLLRNPNVSAVYKLLYISLIDTYPSILSGKTIPINVFKLRQNAGKVSEASATKFFRDMVAINALSYDAGKYDKDAELEEERRVGYVTANLYTFPIPEDFDTRNTEDRKKAREHEQDKRDLIRLVLQCEECGAGSEYIKYTLLPTCKKCGHKHAAIKNVPAPLLTLNQADTDAANLPSGEFDDFKHPENPAKPPARCFGCGKSEFQMNLAKTHWLCMNCDKRFAIVREQYEPASPDSEPSEQEPAAAPTRLSDYRPRRDCYRHSLQDQVIVGDRYICKRCNPAYAI